MIPSAYDIPLHDIKPLMEVPDSSFGFLVTVVVIMVLLLGGGLYLGYLYVKGRKRTNTRQESYVALQKVDFTKPKTAAYAITQHGRVFSEDSERLHAAYANLVELLEAYKYRKRVTEIDEESRSYYKIYLEMIDV